MDQLCWNYKEARQKEKLSLLLIVATFIFDFFAFTPSRTATAAPRGSLPTSCYSPTVFRCSR
jgi:hypothetical protein